MANIFELQHQILYKQLTQNEKLTTDKMSLKENHSTDSVAVIKQKLKFEHFYLIDHTKLRAGGYTNWTAKERLIG